MSTDDQLFDILNEILIEDGYEEVVKGIITLKDNNKVNRLIKASEVYSNE